MSNMRFKALEIAITRTRRSVDPGMLTVSEYFGEQTFGPMAMEKYLPAEDHHELITTINQGGKSEGPGRQSGNALRDWAVAKGATHYTHWFHPLTGSTAKSTTASSSLQKEGRLSKPSAGQN
jgi:glutamine synthetase